MGVHACVCALCGVGEVEGWWQIVWGQKIKQPVAVGRDIPGTEHVKNHLRDSGILFICLKALEPVFPSHGPLTEQPGP